MYCECAVPQTSRDVIYVKVKNDDHAELGEEGSSGDEDSAAENDFVTPRNAVTWKMLFHSHQGVRALVRGVLLTTLAAPLAYVVLAAGAAGRALGGNTVVPRGFIDTDEFAQLIKEQPRALLGRNNSDVERHADEAVGMLRRFVRSHLTPSQQRALDNARLSSQDWDDLRAIGAALADRRVQKAGHMVMQTARENLLWGPAEIGEQVMKRLEKPAIRALVDDTLPRHLREGLVRRWGRQSRPSLKEVWHMALDPTGESLKRMRNHTSKSDSVALTRRLEERQLRGGTWWKPELNGVELATGITALVFITAAEIMLHLDILIPAFAIPEWVNLLIFTPAAGLGIASCIIGLSFWCDYALGALGVNALDAFVIAVHIDGVATVNYKDMMNQKPPQRQSIVP